MGISKNKLFDKEYILTGQHTDYDNSRTVFPIGTVLHPYVGNNREWNRWLITDGGQRVFMLGSYAFERSCKVITNRRSRW